VPAPVFTLDNPEHINARDGATGGDINRMYGSVCLGEPGIDFSSEAEFTKEFGCLMLVLLPRFHQPDPPHVRSPVSGTRYRLGGTSVSLLMTGWTGTRPVTAPDLEWNDKSG